MAVIKNKKILKCLLMMVVSLLLILNFSIEVSTSTNYDRQEVDACITISQRLSVKGGSYTPINKTKLWGQEKYVTEKGLNTVKQHLSGEMEADFNNAMIGRLENAYINNAKISGADLDFYSHEIYESMMMKNGMSYEAAHEAAKAYYNAVEFNLYHPDVIMQYKREFNPAWFRFWEIEEN